MSQADIQTLNKVESRAQVALHDSPIFALKGLQVSQHSGHLLISGRVSTFYYKQLAQEAVRAVAQGLQVVNEIAVDKA